MVVERRREVFFREVAPRRDGSLLLLRDAEELERAVVRRVLPVEDFFRTGAAGAFAPSRLASERPIAIACLRLVTFVPELPLRSVPSFRSCMARSTFADAFRLYFLLDGLPACLPARSVRPSRVERGSAIGSSLLFAPRLGEEIVQSKRPCV